MTAPDAPLAVDVEDVSKSFGGVVAVNHISMRVPRGQVLGFLGPNGSGKTTFLRMLCGLLSPDSGRGTCLGLDFRTQQRSIKERVGYMTQRFGFYEDLSVAENLDFAARLYRVPRRAAAVAAALERLGLVDRRRQMAGALSGGWKQRLALAACLIHEPELLLLDEPTAGVDPKARRDFWDQIHGLAARGLTFLVTTHYMDEAERCHRLAYIAYGDLLAGGTGPEIIAASGLHTLSVAGPGLDRLAAELRGRAGVEQVVRFGNTLHASGRDAAALEAAIAPFRGEGRAWTPVPASLEDVFIALMDRDRAHAGRGAA